MSRRYLAVVLAWMASSTAGAKAPPSIDAPCLTTRDVGNCEFFEQKDWNRKLVIEMGDELDYRFSQSELRKGKAYIGFRSFTANDFSEEFDHVPRTAGRSIFKKGLVTILAGVFMAESKDPIFYTSDKHLDPEFVRKVGRKITVKHKVAPHKVAINKLVKHSIPFLPKINIEMEVEASVFDHRSGSWEGSKESRIDLEEAANLARSFEPSLPQDAELRYTLSTLTRSKKGVLNGCFIVTSFYEVDGGNKIVVVTRQFVGLRLNWIVRKVLKLKPSLLTRTVFRDYARFVDAFRE